MTKTYPTPCNLYLHPLNKPITTNCKKKKCTACHLNKAVFTLDLDLFHTVYFTETMLIVTMESPSKKFHISLLNGSNEHHCSCTIKYSRADMSQGNKEKSTMVYLKTQNSSVLNPTVTKHTVPKK